MTRPPTSVVLGAAGGTGRALVAELAGRGHRVRAVTRTGTLPGAPAGVAVVAADVTDPAALAPAVAGADVVHHAAQPAYTRWVEELPAMNEAIGDAAGRAGALLVVADNLYMYGPGGSPMTESTPQRATDKKGVLRAETAQRLLDRHAAGDVRVVLGRSSDYYGPGGTGTCFGTPLFAPLLGGGGPVRWIGDLDAPHTAHHLPDLARGLAVLAEHPGSAGRAWHLPAAPPITARRFLELAAAGRPYDLEVADEATARAIGAHVPMVAEVADIAYQWTAPFLSDASAFEAALGPLSVTPHEVAVPATTAWFRRHLGL